MRIPLLICAVSLVAFEAGARGGERASAQDTTMVSIPGGVYRAVTSKVGEPPQQVGPYLLDREPVTNAAFLAFVQANRSWRRDRVPRLMADGTYLAQWSGPEALGTEAPPRAPVVGVSWFAARAFCAARAARLPSEAEWEVAAAASPRARDGRRDPRWRQTVLGWYMRPNPARLPDVGGGIPNAWGIFDLHGLVWEWVNDFGGSMLVGADARVCGAGAAEAVDPLDYPAFARAAFRSALTGSMTTRNLGFRCAKDVSVTK